MLRFWTRRQPQLTRLHAAAAAASARFINIQMGEEELKKGEALKRFTRDLSAVAQEGRLDPVIGRATEIQRTIQVLSRRTKNNPVLLGAPGTGKTAIVEGLAQRIATGEVPDSVKGKRVLSLDLSALISGTGIRGEFEKRFKSLLNDVKEEAGNVVLFADEMHQLVGMGGTGEGSMDAANILKPALARGELRLVGATTFEEYRKYIEKDMALARRFQPVYISEPSVNETVAILRGLKEKYELHHGIRIHDSAVVAAAAYAKRYLTERKLPDGAIDLMDEASSRLRMQKESKPDELAALDRDVLTLRIELGALKKETDSESVERREVIENTLKEKLKESDQKTAVWQKERSRRARAVNVQEKLDEARRELELAQSKGNYSRAGELKYDTIPSLETEVSHLAPLLRSEAVTESDVAAVVSLQTGIPVSRLMLAEKDRLLHLEDHLRKRIVGQEYAIEAVSNCIRIARAGLSSPTKPIGSFLFLGSSGVGKTELSKALAEFMFNDENAMLRIDMSEYGERHTVSRLIGSPPGYVGYDEGGQLTEPIRRRPYQVILLDEVEKAHRDVCNVLLQLFDDGRLTDGSGRTVDFRNTLVILTSNLGSRHLDHQRRSHLVDQDREQDMRVTMDAVREHFPPEFINRLDEAILFENLSIEDMNEIAKLQLDKLAASLKSEQRIHLLVDESARNFIAQTGFDPAYGARPLKRVIQRLVLNPLSQLLLAGEVEKGNIVSVLRNGDELELKVSKEGDALVKVPDDSASAVMSA